MRAHGAKSAVRHTGLGLVVVCLCLCFLGCADGPKVAADTPQAQGGSSEALRGVASVHLMASDSSIHAQASRRVQKTAGLRVVDKPAPGVPVLSLQFDCGNDFVFMGRAIEHPACNMLDQDQIDAKVTPPETAAGSCVASLVLIQGGQTVWWCKDTVRVSGRSDVVFAADRMVDRFTAAWKSANP